LCGGARSRRKAKKRPHSNVEEVQHERKIQSRIEVIDSSCYGRSLAKSRETNVADKGFTEAKRVERDQAKRGHRLRESLREETRETIQANCVQQPVLLQNQKGFKKKKKPNSQAKEGAKRTKGGFQAPTVWNKKERVKLNGQLPRFEPSSIKSSTVVLGGRKPKGRFAEKVLNTPLGETVEKARGLILRGKPLSVQRLRAKKNARVARDGGWGKNLGAVAGEKTSNQGGVAGEKTRKEANSPTAQTWPEKTEKTVIQKKKNSRGEMFFLWFHSRQHEQRRSIETIPLESLRTNGSEG